MNSAAVAFIVDAYLREIIQFKNLIEFAMLIADRKRVIRLVGRQNLLDEMNTLSRLLGMHVESSQFMLETIRATGNGDRFQTSVPWVADSNNEFVIYIGNRKDVELSRGIEANECNADETASVYGYPKCCGENYGSIASGKNWVIALLENSEKTFYDYRSNKFASLFEPCLSLNQDYFPCSLDCRDSLAKCQEAEYALKLCGLGDMLPLVKKHLSGIYLLHDGTLWFSRLFHHDHQTGIFDQFRSVGWLDVSDSKRTPSMPTSIALNGIQLTVTTKANVTKAIDGDIGTKLIVFS